MGKRLPNLAGCVADLQQFGGSDQGESLQDSNQLSCQGKGQVKVDEHDLLPAVGGVLTVTSGGMGPRRCRPKDKQTRPPRPQNGDRVGHQVKVQMIGSGNVITAGTCILLLV
jgi:hypothetical protein